MSEELIKAARAVLDAARAWRVEPECRTYGTLLTRAVDSLNTLLVAETEPAEERVPWARVVAGDSVLLKSGEYAPVVERWTRRSGVQITVELPPVDTTDPDAQPRRRTYTMPALREVTRRAGNADEAKAIELLMEQLGAAVIMSRGDQW